MNRLEQIREYNRSLDAANINAANARHLAGVAYAHGNFKLADAMEREAERHDANQAYFNRLIAEIA